MDPDQEPDSSASHVMDLANGYLSKGLTQPPNPPSTCSSLSTNPWEALLNPPGTLSHVSIVQDIKDDDDYGGPVQELKLHKDQMELVESPVAGRNTIIVAPTGSGKTYVATYIVKHHLESFWGKDGRIARVIFMVPTVPLVSQQKGVLNAHLRDKWKIASISGADIDVPRGQLVKTHHITVMTPQCLVNSLDEKNELERLELSDFSLLIFDECHHCNENHPYMQVMMKYLDIKLGDPESLTDKPLPQVVGMTASLGTGCSALGHVIKMGAQMDADSIATVMENVMDLQVRINLPDDIFISVPSHHINQPFAKIVGGTMGRIEQLIAPDLNTLYSAKSSLFVGGIPSVPPPDARLRDIYVTWVNTLLGRIPELDHSGLKRKLIACLQHLKIYQWALDMHAHLSLEQTKEWLKENMREKQRILSNDGTEHWLLAQWNDLLASIDVLKSVENELLAKLLSTLVAEFHEKPESRAIIFVRTRDLTLGLKKILGRHPELGCTDPQILTSANEKGEKGGQSESEQKEALQKFRSGASHILIATTVAEEGLDIEKCNVTIKYNHVTNDIGMVQKRGRARAAESKSYLLGLSGGVIERELKNMTKEKAMIEVLEELRCKEESFLQIQMDKVQKEQYTERLIGRQMRLVERNPGKRYRLMCQKCDAFICDSENVRRVQCHYVIMDATLWGRSFLEPHNRQITYHELSITGHFSCLECRTKQGNILKIRNVFLPGLKAECFVVVEVGEGVKHKKKQWKQVEATFFKVFDATDEEFETMLSALNPQTEAQMENLPTVSGR